MRGRDSKRWSTTAIRFMVECACVLLMAAAVMGASGLALLAGRWLVDVIGW